MRTMFVFVFFHLVFELFSYVWLYLLDITLTIWVITICFIVQHKCNHLFGMQCQLATVLTEILHCTHYMLQTISYPPNPESVVTSVIRIIGIQNWLCHMNNALIPHYIILSFGASFLSVL